MDKNRITKDNKRKNTLRGRCILCSFSISICSFKPFQHRERQKEHGDACFFTLHSANVFGLASMEARRLAILCSHLRPTRFGPVPPVLGSCCASASDGDKRLGDTQKHNLQDDCVFCKIIRGEAHAFKLYEDDMCLCILDTNPLSHGHSLIIPKSHFPSLDATPPSVVAAMCSKVPSISNAIMKATGCNSFNLLVNNGTAAGQVIFHTHIHVIPRKACDCLWASESLRRRPLNLDEKASQLAARVQEQMLPSNICQDRKNEDFCSSKN